MNEKMKRYYPCDYCDDCKIWLAAFDHPDLKTYEDVIEACVATACSLVGQEVPDGLV